LGYSVTKLNGTNSTYETSAASLAEKTQLLYVDSDVSPFIYLAFSKTIFYLKRATDTTSLSVAAKTNSYSIL
jgi:hypothetical protein